MKTFLWFMVAANLLLGLLHQFNGAIDHAILSTVVACVLLLFIVIIKLDDGAKP